MGVLNDVPNIYSVITTFIITLPAIIFAFIAWRESKKTGKAVNGKMDEYKRLIAENADLRHQILKHTHKRKGDDENISKTNIP